MVQDLAPIDRFRGEWEVLSNFAFVPVTRNGATYRTSEHAFQAAKAISPADAERVAAAPTPTEAKRLGRHVQARPDWEQIKVNVMRECLRSKFSDPAARAKLLSTGQRLLRESNTWHDNYWGDCACPRCAGTPGQNLLGRLLMELRDQLLTELTATSTPPQPGNGLLW
jgi:hypothetical protein